jgi:uncharacterized protein YcbK (DUF882 family)
MGDISDRLSRHEFACKCGCGFQTVDIGNPPALEDVADHFQSLHLAARCYIIIDSGCRCVEHNETVQKEAFKKRGQVYAPYSSRSRHMQGLAVDFHLVIKMHSGTKFKVDPAEVYRYLDKKYYRSCGLGKYVTFTHLDQGPFRRW